MRSFSASDAAFAGFRFMGRHPMTVLMWTLVGFITALGAILLVAIFAGGPILALVRLRGGEPSPEQIGALVLTLLPVILLMIPLGLIYKGVMVAGVNRAILRPEERGFFHLRLGADEMRTAVVLLVQGLAAFGVNMVASIVAGILAVGTIAATGGDMEGAGASPMANVIQLVSWCVLIFLNIKFCLAPPQSFARRTIDIFGSWTLTGGRFWPILGAYLLVGILCFMLMLVAVAAAVGVALALGFSFQAPEEAMKQIPLLVTIGLIVALVFGVIGTISNTAIYAVAPDIYRQISGSDDASAVFA